MVIVLRNINNGSVFYLLNKEKFVVGRKECDLLIQNDQSISRKHAEIHMTDNKLTVIDLGSKYKTFYQTNELAPNVEVPLKINEEIQFGVMTSVYKIEELYYITTSTSLSSEDKIKLRQQLAAIGAKYEESWTPQCTHLTTNKMNLTVKVLHALLDQKIIVTSDFWTKLAENLSNNLPPPKEEDYKNLTISEPLLNSVNISANSDRNHLFQGKTFIFLNEKNKKMMEAIISKAGGSSKSWEKNKMPIKDIIGVKNFLIVQVPHQEDESSFKDLIQHLKKAGKRSIPLQEIAMAILTCSTEKCCNPNFKIVQEVFLTGPSRFPTQNPLAPDTQSEFFTIPEHIKEKTDNSKFIIPDTFDNQMDIKIEKGEGQSKADITSTTNNKDNNIGQTAKRVTNDSHDENPFKKLKLEKHRENVKEEKETPFKKSLETTVSRETSQESNGYHSKEIHTTRKRKAEDPVESKGNINKNNPFAVFSKKEIVNDRSLHRNSSKSNPFMVIQKSKELSPQISKDNAFIALKRKKIETSIRKSPGQLSNTTVPSTLATRTQPEMLSRDRIWDLNDDHDEMWCSKATDSEVKSEQTEDPEMQQYINLFRDKIVIDVLKIVPRSKKAKDVTDGNNFSPVKNFKKFKKVQPMHPQHTIISKDTFITMDPGDITGICDNRREIYDSDEEIRITVQQTNRSKKLIF